MFDPRDPDPTTLQMTYVDMIDGRTAITKVISRWYPLALTEIPVMVPPSTVRTCSADASVQRYVIYPACRAYSAIAARPAPISSRGPRPKPCWRPGDPDATFRGSRPSPTKTYISAALGSTAADCRGGARV
jgi:hypothetical protein